MLRKVLHITSIISLVFIASGFRSGLPAQHWGATKFKARIENISNPDGQTASNDTNWPFALSPGVWLVHDKNAPLFKTEKYDRDKGLEAQPEDGNPAMLAESLKKQPGVKSIGIFNTPVGATAPGPTGPAGVYEFTFTATPGSRLSFAMMFGQSNDLFYAPNDMGISNGAHIVCRQARWRNNKGRGTPHRSGMDTGAYGHAVVSRKMNEQYAKKILERLGHINDNYNWLENIRGSRRRNLPYRIKISKWYLRRT